MARVRWASWHQRDVSFLSVGFSLFLGAAFPWWERRKWSQTGGATTKKGVKKWGCKKNVTFIGPPIALPLVLFLLHSFQAACSWWPQTQRSQVPTSNRCDLVAKRQNGWDALGFRFWFPNWMLNTPKKPSGWFYRAIIIWSQQCAQILRNIQSTVQFLCHLKHIFA